MTYKDDYCAAYDRVMRNGGTVSEAHNAGQSAAAASAQTAIDRANVASVETMHPILAPIRPEE